MPLIIPNEGEIELLRKSIKDALSVDESMSLRLYTAVSPALGPGTTLAHFTEATFTGYSAKTLTRAGAATPTTNGSGEAETSWAQQTWTNNGSLQSILGYYVVGATSGKVLWAEAFSEPVGLNGGGVGVLNLTPKLTFRSAS